MARRNMSARKHARKFHKSNRKHKAINAPRYIPRGGIRL